MQLTTQQQQLINTVKDPNTSLVKTIAVAGSGKAQPNSEPVLTPTGFQSMGSLRPNDYVIGSKGPVKVLSIHPQGLRDIYEISFKNGTSVRCDLDHLWTVYHNGRKKTLTVKEMLSTWISKKVYDKRYNTYQTRYNFAIPRNAPCEFSSNEELPIDPYTLGVILGDGHIGKTISITNASLKLLQSLVLPKDCYLSKPYFRNNCYTVHIRSNAPLKGSTLSNSMSIHLKALGLNGTRATTKFIPKQYLNAPLKDRKALLQGLLDTDGYKEHGKYGIQLSSLQLIKDVKILADSIGMHMSAIHPRTTKYSYKGSKKQGAIAYRIKELSTQYNSIIKITKLNYQEESTCISVDSEDHLYVTTGFNLTHNTHSLIALAKALNPKKALYLAYNKAIAEEATKKFKGTTVTCSTIHSLAYNAVVQQYGLRIGHFGVRNLDESLSYQIRKKIVDYIEDFCLSEYTDPTLYLKTKYVTPIVGNTFIDTIDAMATGNIACSHSFYLKLYHVLLSEGKIPIPEYDLIMVDEFGDITGLTLAIFKLLKAPKKIAVGDPLQNIYSFNKTINGFEALKSEGVNCNLTNSFRVEKSIAKRIEAFIQKEITKDFVFTGREYTDFSVKTKAYISRTNAGLIDKMLSLKDSNVCFHTTRKIEQILHYPLILIDLLENKPIKDSHYKYLVSQRTKFYKTPILLKKYTNLFEYLLTINRDDTDFCTTLKMVKKRGNKTLKDLTEYAKNCRNSPCNYTLTTVHSSKGLQFDEVEIAEDLNTRIATTKVQLMKAKMSKDTSRINALMEEFRLYYVAVSRTKVRLINAQWLPTITPE